MNRTLTPKEVTLTLRPDGGARVKFGITGDTYELDLSPAQWEKLGADARWFAGAGEAPAKQAEGAVLDRFGTMLQVEERVQKLEEKVSFLLRKQGGVLP